MTIDTTTAVRTEFAKSIARTVLLFAGTILAGTTRRRYNTMHLPLTLHTKAYESMLPFRMTDFV